jgi:aspartyl protease family protein
MTGMDFAPIWDQLVQSIHALPKSGLLMAAVGAMLLGVVGTVLIRPVPTLGKLLRTVSTFGLMGVLLLVVLQLSRMDPRFEFAVPEIGLPKQVVEGGETRVPLAGDGHFWLRAQVNGQPVNFLVDTGATLTAVSAETASAVGLEPRNVGLPVRMQTANGAVAAHLTTIDELRFGNVAAHGLDAVIAPNLGPTNVLGMNFLSRLASWRVEDNTMILVPRHAQSELELGAY